MLANGEGFFSLRLMPEQYLPLIMYAGVALGIGIAGSVLAAILGPKISSPHKFDPYECGMDQMDNTHKPFAVKFYVVALVFMLFDIETIFLLPWAIGYKAYGLQSLGALLFFTAVLGLGLWYIIKERVLEWE